MMFQNPVRRVMSMMDAHSDDEDPQPALGESDDETSDAEELDAADLSTDQLRAMNKLNSVATIEQLRIAPIQDSRMSIPLMSNGDNAHRSANFVL